MASYLHRTATTIYPCCIPALGDSTGAGRVRLAAANVGEMILKAKMKFYSFQKMNSTSQKPQF